MEKIKVLVTGGAGFIGSHIVEELLNSGYSKGNILVIDNLSSGKRVNIPAGVPLVVNDIKTQEANRAILEFAPDVIIHAAAQISVRVSMQDPVFDVQDNIAGTLNILNTIIKLNKIPFFIFLSTGGAIYGEQKEFPAKESHPIAPTSVYGLSKRCVELYLDLWKRVYNLSFLSLRLGNVYGPRQDPHGEAGVVAIFTKKLLKEEEPVIFGTGEQTRDYIFVKDVVRALLLGIKTKSEGILNIGTGIETTVNKLYKIITNAVGKEMSPRYADPREGEQFRSCIDPSLAREILNWEPITSLEEGIERTVNWFRDH